jgi:alkaline phosphatase
MNLNTKFFFLFLLASLSLGHPTFAQARRYSVANAHAHNDYIHPAPFYTAYNAGFGSIEADIFLKGDRLCVAHDTASIDAKRTLQALYLDPLEAAIKKNKGRAYANGNQLLLLIDLKTEALTTLNALIKVLKHYKKLIDCKTLKIVITGNQPEPSKLSSYPSYIFFDGKLNETYAEAAMKKIALFSENFRNFSAWKGDGPLPGEDSEKISRAVSAAHQMNRPIRFWAAPDDVRAWQQLMVLDVDYLNTDKIPEISIFLMQLYTKEQ